MFEMEIVYNLSLFYINYKFMNTHNIDISEIFKNYNQSKEQIFQLTISFSVYYYNLL